MLMSDASSRAVVWLSSLAHKTFLNSERFHFVWLTQRDTILLFPPVVLQFSLSRRIQIAIKPQPPQVTRHEWSWVWDLWTRLVALPWRVPSKAEKHPLSRFVCAFLSTNAGKTAFSDSMSTFLREKRRSIINHIKQIVMRNQIVFHSRSSELGINTKEDHLFSLELCCVQMLSSTHNLNRKTWREFSASMPALPKAVLFQFASLFQKPRTSPDWGGGGQGKLPSDLWNTSSSYTSTVLWTIEKSICKYPSQTRSDPNCPVQVPHEHLSFVISRSICACSLLVDTTIFNIPLVDCFGGLSGVILWESQGPFRANVCENKHAEGRLRREAFWILHELLWLRSAHFHIKTKLTWKQTQTVLYSC